MLKKCSSLNISFHKHSKCFNSFYKTSQCFCFDLFERFWRGFMCLTMFIEKCRGDKVLSFTFATVSIILFSKRNQFGKNMVHHATEVKNWYLLNISFLHKCFNLHRWFRFSRKSCLSLG